MDIFGVGGRRIYKLLERDLHAIFSVAPPCPQVCVLLIGWNDIDSAKDAGSGDDCAVSTAPAIPNN